MGLLDDAIREHLDLKRRRGADPAEVERAEREALGPVRRNRDPGDQAASDDESGLTAEAYDQADDDNWSHDSLHEPAADADVAEPAFEEPPLESTPPPPAFRAAPEHARRDEPDALGAEDDELSRHEEPGAPPPFPTAGPSSRPLTDMGGGETMEYNVEDVLAADEEGEPPAEDDDVLEETPEFLQDTPDHDRLWFEQRPPKDFDFDG